jgi:site-specific DNA recombinase
MGWSCGPAEAARTMLDTMQAFSIFTSGVQISKRARMKAIGYVRVSTQGQVEDGVSLDAQEAKIRAWAVANDAAEVTIYRDEGLSGKRAVVRPGLAAALEVVRPGDALVCYSLSRLSRSTKDTLALAEALAKKDADLVSMSEKIDTTSAAGKMIFRLLAVLAEFERDQVSDRTRFALAHKRANGEKTGGSVPFGYRVRRGKLVKDAEEQKAIDLVLALHGRGESLRGIGHALEAAGIARKGGSPTWPPVAVLRIIRRHEQEEKRRAA